MVEIHLNGQVGLVTGGGTGIGRAICLRLAQAGVKVAVNFNHSQMEAQQVVSEIISNGGEAIAYKCDVTNEQEVIQLVEKVEKDLGPITILVNNAGSLVERCKIEEMSEQLWESVTNVNQKSVFLCSKHVIPTMKKKQYGRIINISSIAARNGGGMGAVVYAASKAAVSAFTKGLAKELCDYGILVNGVAPGTITTAFHDRFTSNEARANIKKTIPLNREGTPEEVADAVLYLASPLSSFLLGEMIEVNGGQLMD